MANALVRNLFRLFVLALALSVLTIPAIWAQDAETEADQTALEEEGAVLDVIVVTAQKRVEDAQEVPISVATLTADDLEALTVGAADVRFLSSRVPSLHIESSFGRAFPRFYIRGLGNTDFDLNASQPVSMIYDEIVLENPIMKGMPIWDMERIEVLRGPQGTLFGRNTPAGIVKFESKRPTWDFESSVRASYGTYDTTDITAVISGPLGDNFSARFSGLYQSRSDWVDNTFTGVNDAVGGYDTAAFRIQFLWEPTENFSALFNVHAWDVDGTARLFRANIIEKGTSNLVSDFRFDRISQDGQNSQDIEARGGMLKLEWDLGTMTLTSVTGWETLEMFSRGDIDGGFGAVFAPPSGPGFIPFPSESADGLPDLDQLTQEFRLSSNSDGPFNWLTGFFYFNEELQADTFSFNTLGGGEQDGYSFQVQESDAWALFASVNYQFNERFNLQGGIRYSHDEKDFRAERPDPTFQLPTFAPILASTDTDITSWDLSGTYKVNPDVNVFGRIATSFRAPSIQGRILFCPDFDGGLNPDTDCVDIADEEEIISFELGIKSEFMANRLRLNFTAYTYEVEGQQIVAVGGAFNTATLLNADKTDGYGFEAEMVIAPTSAWLITLGLGNNNTEINDPNLSVGACGGGCTILDPILPDGSVSVDGNSLPHAPEWTFNGIIDFRQPIGDGLFGGTLDWAWHDEKRFFLYESTEYRADGFELGLRLSYLFPDGKYEVALFGRNITDEEILRNGIDFNNLTGMVNDPATWGLQFVARF